MLLHLYFNHVVKMRVLSLLLSALLSFANSQNFYVIPSDDSYVCPPGEECHQLSYYADHSSMLLPDSNLIFLNGEHILEKEVTLSGFDYLILYGVNDEWSEGPHESTMQSSVIIRCTSDSIIAFNITFTQTLALTSLTVTGCKTAFSLNNVTALIMEKMSIQNNSFFGLNWEFYNHQNQEYSCQNQDYYCENRGVMILESSFYQNCLHPPIVNGLIKECCHLQLITYEMHYTSLYHIMHSNFSFGTNFDAGVCLIVPITYNNFPLRVVFGVKVSHCLFLNNTGSQCGGLLLESSNYVDFSIEIIDSMFLYNKLDTNDCSFPCAGGIVIAVGIKSGGRLVIYNSLFQENYEGGAVVVVFVQRDVEKQNLTLIAVTNSIFTNNTGDTTAALSVLSDDVVNLWNTSVLYNNNYGVASEDLSALFLYGYELIVTFFFFNVTISHNSMTGINVVNCYIGVSDGPSVVSNNTSNYAGGGLLLGLRSGIYSADSGRMIFKNNRARTFGGAIYSVRNPYGFDPIDIFKVLSHINKPISLSVSSDPLGLCLCTDAGITDCTIRLIHRKVYPGSVITLSLAVVGMCGGITPGIVLTQAYSINVTLENTNQQTDAWKCKEFRYLLKQVDQYVHNGQIVFESNLIDFPLTVGISFLECPPGLYLVSSGFCDCNPVIGSVPNVKCNVSWADTPVRRSGNI